MMPMISDTELTSGPRRSFPDRPIVGIGAVVWKGDHVLLIRRAKAPYGGRWSLPGGAQELGETIREAAKREIREETGIEIDVLGVVDCLDSIDRTEDGRFRHHYTIIDVAALWTSGHPTPGDDAEQAIWAHRGDLAHFELWSEAIRIIQKSRNLIDPPQRSRKDSDTDE